MSIGKKLGVKNKAVNLFEVQWTDSLLDAVF